MSEGKALMYYTQAILEPKLDSERANGHDNVNHPAHYTFGKHEVIDIIEDWGLSFHRGNALKYLARAGRKGGADKEVEDLKKSVFYLQREIARLEGVK